MIADRHEALAAIDDGTLKELHTALGEVAQRFGWRGLDVECPPAARWLLEEVVASLGYEAVRRHKLFDSARIAVEANGHEVFIIHDIGETWSAVCSCDDVDLTPVSGTKEEARRIAGDHAADHGGQWQRELTDPGA